MWLSCDTALIQRQFLQPCHMVWPKCQESALQNDTYCLWNRTGSRDQFHFYSLPTSGTTLEGKPFNLNPECKAEYSMRPMVRPIGNSLSRGKDLDDRFWTFRMCHGLASGSHTGLSGSKQGFKWRRKLRWLLDWCGPSKPKLIGKGFASHLHRHLLHLYRKYSNISTSSTTTIFRRVSGHGCPHYASCWASVSAKRVATRQLCKWDGRVRPWFLLSPDLPDESLAPWEEGVFSWRGRVGVSVCVCVRLCVFFGDLDRKIIMVECLRWLTAHTLWQICGCLDCIQQTWVFHWMSWEVE